MGVVEQSWLMGRTCVRGDRILRSMVTEAVAVSGIISILLVFQNATNRSGGAYAVILPFYDRQGVFGGIRLWLGLGRLIISI